MPKQQPSPEAVEYQSLLRTAMLAGAMLQPFDIDAALQAINHADSVGPILDPTLWRDKHKAMDLDRELLEAARPLAALARRRMELLMQRYGEELQEEAGTLAKAVIHP